MESNPPSLFTVSLYYRQKTSQMNLTYSQQDEASPDSVKPLFLSREVDRQMFQMKVVPKIPGTSLVDALKNTDKVFRQLANQTNGQEYTNVPIAFQDLKNNVRSEETQLLDKDLQCQCMTSSDNITACALTN